MAAPGIPPPSSIAASFVGRNYDRAIGYSRQLQPIPVADRTVMDPSGLAVIDAAGAAVVADPRYASLRTLAALRLLASRPDLDERALLAVVHASTLAGNKAALTKRVRAAIGADTGAVLYRIENGKVMMAEATRRSLARHFGFAA